MKLTLTTIREESILSAPMLEFVKGGTIPVSGCNTDLCTNNTAPCDYNACVKNGSSCETNRCSGNNYHNRPPVGELPPPPPTDD